MSEKEKQHPEKTESICKIVYFDEGSVSDYIQIVNCGELSLYTELKEDTAKQADASAEARVSGGFGALKLLFGFNAEASASGSASASFDTSLVAKSIVTNTVLTDFLEIVDVPDNEKSGVRKFEGFRIQAIDNTMSNFALMTPYLSMMRSGQGIPAGDFNIAVDKLDSTLNNAKGYFEFLGRDSEDSQSEEVVFRFNNSVFKNNYKASDLLRMNLTIYAVRVGTCRIEELDINNELHVEGINTTDNPDFPITGDVSSTPSGKNGPPLVMYDVLLAGVQNNG